MRKLLTIALLPLLLIGCRDEIDLDLNETDPRLVVEGLITDLPGPYFVKLSMSTDYFGDNPSPQVTGALVVIAEDSTLKDTLIETTPGVYRTQSLMLGKVGSTYHLMIRTLGETYEATTTLNAVAEIDFLTYKFRDGIFYDDNGIYVQSWGQEPEGLGDYYRWVYYSNGEIADSFDILIGDDSFVDGNYIGDFEVFFQEGVNTEDYVQDTGDVVKIEQYSLTEEAYNFYDQLIEHRSFGNLFDVPPTNITGNISNGAWGLFEASSVESAEITIGD